MANPKNRATVEEALRTELERDRTKTYVVEISPLGLVEMTRQNVTDGPREILYDEVRRVQRRRLRRFGDDACARGRAQAPGDCQGLARTGIPGRRPSARAGAARRPRRHPGSPTSRPPRAAGSSPPRGDEQWPLHLDHFEVLAQASSTRWRPRLRSTRARRSRSSWWRLASTIRRRGSASSTGTRSSAPTRPSSSGRRCRRPSAASSRPPPSRSCPTPPRCPRRSRSRPRPRSRRARPAARRPRKPTSPLRRLRGAFDSAEDAAKNPAAKAAAEPELADAAEPRPSPSPRKRRRLPRTASPRRSARARTRGGRGKKKTTAAATTAEADADAVSEPTAAKAPRTRPEDPRAGS